MDRSRVAVIIPALNEVATIEGVVSRVRAYGIPIVIDDGSSDGTGDVARRSGATVVEHSSNMGYDAALNSGFAAAAAIGCDYLITIDADGQQNPEQLSDYIRHLSDGYDLVLGVRERMQRFAERAFAVAGVILWRMHDPLCGMKGYRVESYRKFGAFDTLRSIGTELAVRIVANGGKQIEIRVLTNDRKDAPRFGRAIDANFRILRALLILSALQITGRLKLRTS